MQYFPVLEMIGLFNPALAAFVAQLGDELVFAQVLVRRLTDGFELRHMKDRHAPADMLRAILPMEVRTLAQSTVSGAFRPLKSAPTLQSGWRLAVHDEEELETTLNHLYPGAIADGYAARSDSPPITHYRQFTQRQTGMYRITTRLDDPHAARVTRACCDRKFCLKRRLWTVEGLAQDSADEKSLIPCLEPCAILLEVARNSMRTEQEDKVHVELAPSELRTIKAAIEAALAHPDSTVREADFNAPANPRRLKLVLEKLAPVLAQASTTSEEEEN